MQRILLICCLLLPAVLARYSRVTAYNCTSDFDCNSGACRFRDPRTETNGTCYCSKNHVTYGAETEETVCNYKQKGKLEMFLISFFVVRIHCALELY